VLGPDQRGLLHVDDMLAGRAAAGMAGFVSGVRWRGSKAYGARLGGPVERLVIPLLPYDLYLPMLWRGLAQRRAMADFSEMAQDLIATPRGWSDVVADLVAGLQPRQTLILPAPASAAEALAVLVPEVDLVAAQSGYHDAPDTALRMLQRLYRQKVVIAPHQVARLVAFHAKLPQPAPIAAFTAADAAGLRRRFAADLDRIGALAGVEIAGHPKQSIAAE